MNRMPLQVSSVSLMWRQGTKNEIGLFLLHPPGEELADIPNLGYPGNGYAQFEGSSEEMILMAMGMTENGLVAPFVVGGVQHKLGIARRRQRDGIAGGHGGCGVFVDN
jgi:hypothetical protein